MAADGFQVAMRVDDASAIIESLREWISMTLDPADEERSWSHAPIAAQALSRVDRADRRATR
jgi:hypothetical protein